MSAPPTPDVADSHRAIAVDILRAHLPAGARVWIFGSRARGQAKPFSDLDRAIDAGRALRRDELAALAEAFSESDLPCKVDLLDERTTDPGFRARLEPERVPLPLD